MARSTSSARRPPDAFDGVDIALFSAGGDTSKALAPRGRPARRDGHRQLVGVADGPGRAARRVSQVNPDDLERHEGIIANPNCSTMQLVPVLMALRDAVGLERVVVDTYQAVSGTGGKAIKELQAQVEAHVGGQPHRERRLPAPDRVQRPPAGRCLPRQRLHQGGVEGRHGEPQDPAPAGPAHLEHGRPRPGVRRPQRGRPRRDPRADHPGSRPDPVRGRPRRRRPGRPVDLDLSARDRGRRLRRDLRRAGPPGPVHRRRARPRLLGRQRQPAQGRGDERRPARRGPGRARLGQGGRGTERGRNARRDRRRAPCGARGDRGRGPRLHALPPPRDPHEGRPRRGRPVHRGHVRRRGPGHERGPRGPAVRRPRRRPAREPARPHRLEPRGRLHHQHRQVPPARQPRSRAGRDRRLRAVPATPARGARSVGRRHPRPLLDGPVHARRPDQPGPRHDPPSPTRQTGARDATVFAMYHPAAALRTPAIERESYDDVAPHPGRAHRGPGAPRRAARAARAAATSRQRRPQPTDRPRDAAATATTRPPGSDPADPSRAPSRPMPDPAADQLSLF